MNRWSVGLISLFTFFLLATPVNACTIFMGSMDGVVLVGNNEDWSHANFTICFVPPIGNRHGFAKFVATENYYDIRGGMNDQGVFVDSAAVPASPVDYDPEKPSFPDDMFNTILRFCETTQEAVELFEENVVLVDEWNWQLLVADAKGDAVVIGAGPDRQIAFTWKNGTFHLVTNGNIAYPELGQSEWSETRYNSALEMLNKLEHPDNVSIDYFTSILENVSCQYTAYSNVYDLVNLEIYTYYTHNYMSYVKFNLTEELQKGSHCYDLQELFSKSTSSTSSTTSSTVSSTIPYSMTTTELLTTSTSTTFASTQTNPTDSTQPVIGPLLVIVSLGTLGLIVLFVTRLVLKGNAS